MSNFYYDELPQFIKELYVNDATVNAYINIALRNKISYTEILEKLVVALAQEKKDISNLCLETMQKSVKPIFINKD